MKKRFWFLAAVGILVVTLSAPAAFGAITGNDQKGQDPQNQQSFNQMFDWHQQWLAQKDGQVTPDQAKTWQEHFNYMRDFHNKNGFAMGSMMGGNGFNGMMGNFNGSNGYGGMIGGSFNNQTPSK